VERHTLAASCREVWLGTHSPARSVCQQPKTQQHACDASRRSRGSGGVHTQWASSAGCARTCTPQDPNHYSRCAGRCSCRCICRGLARHRSSSSSSTCVCVSSVGPQHKQQPPHNSQVVHLHLRHGQVRGAVVGVEPAVEARDAHGGCCCGGGCCCCYCHRKRRRLRGCVSCAGWGGWCVVVAAVSQE
jgi:hypothetical protein